MKNLLLISLMLLLGIQSEAQPVKIRWYDINKPGIRHTVKISPDGEPSGKYFLVVKCHGQYFHEEAMYRLLQDNLWPDVPFAIHVPVLSELPPRIMKVQVEPGNSISVPNPYYETAVERRDALLEAFYQRFTIVYPEVQFVWVQKRVFKTLPDGPDIRWELMDDSKPYRYRFTPIDVVPGKYSEKIKLVEYPSPGDEYWEKITRQLSTRIVTKGAVKGLKWVCEIK